MMWQVIAAMHPFGIPAILIAIFVAGVLNTPNQERMKNEEIG
tara:strand:+ start:616 stop:741 length:126 start_codon:yes stop_codon:yes gene_type:complete